MTKHNKVLVHKNKKYRVDEKTYSLHMAKNLHRGCTHDDVVVNLMGGERVWTMVQFGCGERLKINCQRLRKP